MDADAREWVARAASDAGLGAVGAFEPVKIRPWASVLRASTGGGDVYFKANAAGGRHEPALVAELARDWPQLVPAPLAIDRDRGWLLTRDCGERMADAYDDDRTLRALEELLPRYAEIQIASAREPERWLSLGVPDLRVEGLGAIAERLIRENADLAADERAASLGLLPDLAAHCRALDALPFASALEHGDLHPANVLVGARGTWIFDWADASLCHPFCSLLVTCDMVVEDLASPSGRRAAARLRDAYLEPFAATADAAELRELFSVASWVAHLIRALDFDRMLPVTDAPDVAEWRPRIAAWLRLWTERRAWARTWP